MAMMFTAATSTPLALAPEPRSTPSWVSPPGVRGLVRDRGTLDVEVDLLQVEGVDHLLVRGGQVGRARARLGQLDSVRTAEGDANVAACRAQITDLLGRLVVAQLLRAAPLGRAPASGDDEREVERLDAGTLRGIHQVVRRIQADVDVRGVAVCCCFRW